MRQITNWLSLNATVTSTMSSRKNDIEVSVHCRLVILFFSRFFFFFFLALCLRFVFWCKQYPLVDDLLYSRYLRAWHILNSGIHVPYICGAVCSKDCFHIFLQIFCKMWALRIAWVQHVIYYLSNNSYVYNIKSETIEHSEHMHANIKERCASMTEVVFLFCKGSILPL